MRKYEYKHLHLHTPPGAFANLGVLQGWEFMPRPRPRIVGGVEATPYEYPHVVSLRKTSDGGQSYEHVCAGSLIHQRWVLTAAHCLTTPAAVMYQVGLYRHDNSDDDEHTCSEELGVEEIHRHAGFNSTSLAHDIALLKLKADAACSVSTHSSHTPSMVVRLDGSEGAPTLVAADGSLAGAVLSGWGTVYDQNPTDDAGESVTVPEGTWLCTDGSGAEYASDTNAVGDGTAVSCVTMAGWGTLAGNAALPGSLRKITAVPVLSRSTCSTLLAHDPTYDNTWQLCAGFVEGGKDACQGDSGGPLFVPGSPQATQLGLISYGEGCAVAGSIGVYVRVSAYLDWICSQAPELAPPPPPAAPPHIPRPATPPLWPSPPSPPAAPPDSPHAAAAGGSGSSGPSSGAIAGIVSGSLAAFVALCLCVACIATLWRSERRFSRATTRRLEPGQSSARWAEPRSNPKMVSIDPRSRYVAPSSVAGGS